VATGADNIDSRCEPSGINREELSDDLLLCHILELGSPGAVVVVVVAVLWCRAQQAAEHVHV
jgi:hypothetical protein